MILQAAINGARRPGEHDGLPLTPDAIAADAMAVLRAGANEVHLHIRDERGDERLGMGIVDPLMKRLRRLLPGTLLGISTGVWIEGDHAKTVACIRDWSQRPDYASLNIQEEGALSVADALQQAGIGIELGLADEADLDRALTSGAVERAFRILIEPGLAATADTPLLMVERLRAAGCTKSILLHGMEEAMWPLFDLAVQQGLSQRLGFEDGLTMPDGSRALNNAASSPKAGGAQQQQLPRGRSC